MFKRASLGPSFGMKGGAAGGGYAQEFQWSKSIFILQRFSCNNFCTYLLSALIDNHIYWGNKLNIDENRIVWKRVLDMNDRALRFININTKGVAKNYLRQDGFDITVASKLWQSFV